ncbi:MAG: phosphotransferase [Burkholderiales bacterium]|nr:phosphotransferase [Burkholderiales bacterium]
MKKIIKALFDSSRLELVNNWLHLILEGHDFTLTDLAADAGARRYFRVTLANKTSLVLMDAPTEYNDARQFTLMAEMLASNGINVPIIKHTNFDDGLLLLSDLGDDTYLKSLNNENANQLFEDATTALVKIQTIEARNLLNSYSAELMNQELKLFDDWYIQKHLEIKLDKKTQESLKNILQLITARCISQSEVLVHRDFMPRNLMICDDNPGVLDFQDARVGPISYDVISLFKDAFISWDEEQILDWTIRYWEKARKASLPVPLDFGDFYKDIEWMGLQRHLKVLGIFSRLKHRDGKDHYISDAPRFLAYVRDVAQRYRALNPLIKILNEIERTTPKIGHTF